MLLLSQRPLTASDADHHLLLIEVQSSAGQSGFGPGPQCLRPRAAWQRPHLLPAASRARPARGALRPSARVRDAGGPARRDRAGSDGNAMSSDGTDLPPLHGSVQPTLELARSRSPPIRCATCEKATKRIGSESLTLCLWTILTKRSAMSCSGACEMACGSCRSNGWLQGRRHRSIRLPTPSSMLLWSCRCWTTRACGNLCADERRAALLKRGACCCRGLSRSSRAWRRVPLGGRFQCSATSICRTISQKQPAIWRTCSQPVRV